MNRISQVSAFGAPTYLGAEGDTIWSLLQQGRMQDAGRKAFYSHSIVSLASSATDTRAWDMDRVVRTYGDFLQLARFVFANAKEIPALKAQASIVERTRDGKGNAPFDRALPFPTLFRNLKSIVAKSPSMVRLVTAKAAEYYKNVEQAGQAKAKSEPLFSAAPSAPSVPASASSFQASTLPSTPASGISEAISLYQQSWFPPVIALSTIGIAAALLWPKGGKGRR